MAVKELYVGNLLYDVSLDEVTRLFSPYGVVHDARLVAERKPGHPHAYGFVLMEESAAEEAILALDGENFMGQTLLVEETKSDAVENP